MQGDDDFWKERREGYDNERKAKEKYMVKRNNTREKKVKINP